MVLVYYCVRVPSSIPCVCRELEVLQGEVVESKLTMDGKQKVGVATFTFITTTLGLPFHREVVMVFSFISELVQPKGWLSKGRSDARVTLFQIWGFLVFSTWPQADV